MKDVLRTLRRGRGLTMEQTAQAAGIHRSTLHRWEKGLAQPRLPELKSLLKALAANPEQRRKAVSLIDAPRALEMVRRGNERKVAQSGIGPQPHGGDLLRAMRLRRGLSLEEAAPRIGVSTATLRRWEGMDTWPSIEQLHRLCFTLKASAEELESLTSGQFSRYARRAEVNANELAERLARFRATLNHPPFHLRDLELLTLLADAWMLASDSASEVRWLTSVYAAQSLQMYYRDRYPEAVTAAERYLELLPRFPQDHASQINWGNMRLITIGSSLHIPGRITPRQAVQGYQSILAHFQGTIHESTLLAQISEALFLQSAQYEALQAFGEAYGAARRNIGDEHALWVRGQQGVQIIRSGRYAEGLPLLVTGKADDWYRLVETSLWQAEAFLGLGESDDAERALTKAQADLTKYEMTPLQPQLDTLRARLHDEHKVVGK